MKSQVYKITLVLFSLSVVVVLSSVDEAFGAIPTINFVNAFQDAGLYWIFIGHGAIIEVEDPDCPTCTPGIDTIEVDVISKNSGLSEIGRIDNLSFVETGPDTKKFRLSPATYVNFVSGPDDDPALKIHVEAGGKVEALYGSGIGFTWINSPEWGTFPTWDPARQPNKTVKIACPGGVARLADNICASWETASGLSIPYTANGVTETYTWLCTNDPADPDPTKDYPCPTNANKDIYVEVDWLKSHGPDQSAISLVRQSFSSVASPNDNIRLHVLLDDEIPYHSDRLWGPNNGADLAEFTKIKNAYFGTSSERTVQSGETSVNVANLLTAKRQVFHYMLFVHDQDNTPGSSGRAEMPSFSTQGGANDAMISLGAMPSGGGVGTPDQQAGTFMHELGHNLGMNHGGPVTDGLNCKPNYLSVMNYAFQFSDILNNRPLDYSRNALNTLDENNLNEVTGLNTANPITRVTVWGPPPIWTSGQLSGLPNNPISWDKDGNITDPSTLDANINNFGITDCNAGTLSASMIGYDDWSNIKYDFSIASSYADGAGSVEGAEFEDTWVWIIIIIILVIIIIIVAILIYRTYRRSD
ncbi:MAG: zinc-dependent metalloprotease family protein [Nitrosopumilaceae archaeon]